MVNFNDINVGNYVRSYDNVYYCHIAKCIYKDNNFMEFNNSINRNLQDEFDVAFDNYDLRLIIEHGKNLVNVLKKGDIIEYKLGNNTRINAIADIVDNKIIINDSVSCFTIEEKNINCNYEDIVRALFDKVINIGDGSYYDKFDTKTMRVIDDGTHIEKDNMYKGTKVFILHKEDCNPNIDKYVYTSYEYNSKYVIETYTEDLPNDKQVEKYMELSFCLLVGCNYMVAL